MFMPARRLQRAKVRRKVWGWQCSTPGALAQTPQHQAKARIRQTCISRQAHPERLLRIEAFALGEIVLQGVTSVVANIGGALPLPLAQADVNYTFIKINVLDIESGEFSRPTAGVQEEQDNGPIPVIDAGRDQLLDILLRKSWRDRFGQTRHAHLAHGVGGDQVFHLQELAESPAPIGRGRSPERWG